jgi:hypothetical protein
MRSPTVVPSGEAATFAVVADEIKRIEWPPGSGVAADYSPAERDVIRSLFHARDEERITDEEMRRDVGLLHELKAILGATILPAPAEAEQTVLPVAEMPDPDSAFQIPGRALARLRGAA